MFDGVTSARRGGPRFIDETAQAHATALIDDPRTTEQLALDAFVLLVKLGADVRPDVMVGRRGPTVQVLVTARDRETGAGLGFIEGQSEPVSLATVERRICESGLQPVIFDSEGTPFNLGREQRLYSRHQRRAMAARDGGCMFLDCERPPSWCEAHHTKQWVRDHGETNVDTGILFCTHHHMLFHDNGWEIRQEHGQNWLIPPPDVDPQQTPIAMRSKSAAARRLAAQAS